MISAPVLRFIESISLCQFADYEPPAFVEPCRTRPCPRLGSFLRSGLASWAAADRFDLRYVDGHRLVVFFRTEVTAPLTLRPQGRPGRIRVYELVSHSTPTALLAGVDMKEDWVRSSSANRAPLPL